MATASSVTADLTTCSICLEVFTNPKSLPCLHAFCLKCLEGCFTDKCPGDDVNCPLCRKEFKIPAGGLNSLQHHFFVQRLLDARDVSREVTCEVCLEENAGDADNIPTATMYCVDCDQKLCEQCSRPHRRMKGEAHQVKSLGAEMEQELIQLRRSNCDKHKDKRLELYCYECKENICVLCFAVNHRQHETAEMQEVAKTFARQFDSFDQQILSQVDNIRKISKENEKKRNEFLRHADAVTSEIKLTGKEVHKIVDNGLVTHLDEVEMAKSEDAEKAEALEERCKLALVERESFHTYLREIVDKGRPSDIIRAASELEKRAKELLDGDVSGVQYRPPYLSFTAADVSQLKRPDLIGRMTHQPGIAYQLHLSRTLRSVYGMSRPSVVCNVVAP